VSPILESIGSVKGFGWGSFLPSLPPSFESIATVNVGSGGSSDITFSSIPSTYTHLQIRSFARLNSGSQGCTIRINGDTTTTNYYRHALEGDGASIYAYQGNVFPLFAAAVSTTSVFSAAIVDILDYTSTNKNKTIRSLYGVDVNGSGGGVALYSGFRNNTAAVTQIDLKPNFSGVFSEYSSFALYGIKGS